MTKRVPRHRVRFIRGYCESGECIYTMRGDVFRGWVGEDGFMAVSNKNSSVKECYIYIEVTICIGFRHLGEILTLKSV